MLSPWDALVLDVALAAGEIYAAASGGVDARAHTATTKSVMQIIGLRVVAILECTIFTILRAQFRWNKMA